VGAVFFVVTKGGIMSEYITHERDYRVTIDTTEEQYVYEVEAETEDEAKEQGVALAVNDGMEPWRMRWENAEALS
jgi:hypothetical protein